MSNATTRPNGRIIWRGPSLIDGAPLVVIAIGFASASENRKTGDLIQTYILRADVAPLAAIASGADVSICGDCPHRGTADAGRTCYVNVGQGATVVYKSLQRGIYPEWDGTGINGRMVRLGTYGDPAAVPFNVWSRLVRDAVGHTGYTHQWRTRPELRTLCMASADSVADMMDAHAMGWRTFRVVMPGQAPRIRPEAVCPASEEAGRKLTCDTCLACSGADGRKGSIVIQAHGGFAVMANVRKHA